MTSKIMTSSINFCNSDNSYYTEGNSKYKSHESLPEI